MRGVKTLGWVMLTLLTVAALPCTGRAADKDLEDRVRALERKLDQEQKGTVTEQKTVSDRIDAIEKEVKDNEKTLADKTGISMHAMLAVDYLYDLNAPGGSTVGGFPQPYLRTFENEKNSFIINLANLHFERTADNLPGFVADVDFGKTADVVNNATYFGKHSADPNDPSTSIPITGNGTDFFDVRQFYLTYTVPVGTGIKLKAGRFVTLAGAEVIKSYNNFNWNITNSILFGFAIPFTHTGLMSSYAFTDQVSLDFGIVNGWDAVADNNDGKSLHSGLTLAFDPHITFYQTVTYGPEQTGRTVLDNNGVPLVVHAGRSKRLLLTSLITIKPIDPLTLIIDYDYGNDSDSVPVNGLLRTAQWQGAAGYIIYNFTDDLSATLRAEVFDDVNGARVIAFPTGAVGAHATYTEVTPTITYKIADGLWWRNEYRHDESDTKKVFAHNANLVRGQDTLATELIYAF
jgi:hypothetical protein